MPIEELILLNYSQLNEVNLEILQYISSHQKEVSEMSCVKLAKATLSSKSTVTRTVQKLGFKGYSELRHFLKENQKKEKTIYGSIVSELNHDIIETLELIKVSKPEAFLKMLHQSKIVYFYATGIEQRNYAEIFSQQLLSIGKKVVFITDKSYLDAILSMIKPEDMFIIFSLSGETQKLKPFVLKLKTKGIPLVSFTRNHTNYFASHADLSYFYYSTSFLDITQKRESLAGLSILIETLFRMYLEYIQGVEEFENDNEAAT